MAGLALSPENSIQEGNEIPDDVTMLKSHRPAKGEGTSAANNGSPHTTASNTNPPRRCIRVLVYRIGK
jgi:hypothetical protein